MLRRTILCAVLFCASLHGAAFAVTSAGTSIESQAFLTYGDHTVTTPAISATISQIFGLNIYATSAAESIPGGELYYFPKTIENIGNGTSQIFMTSYASPEGWTASLVVDENRDEVHQMTEVASVPASVILSEDADYKFFLVVDAPDSAYVGTYGRGTVLCSTEFTDGSSYFGGNGILYGGEDTVEASGDLQIGSLGNFRIWRHEVTGAISLSWGGGPADVFYRDPFNPDFTAASKEANNIISPWTSEAVVAQDGKVRYYRVAITGSTSFAAGIAGKFDFEVEEGINQLSLPFLPEGTDISSVIGSQVTGANNAGSADRIWRYNPDNPAEYDIAWLVEGVGPPYDGLWYTGGAPTYVSIEADHAFILQIRTGHSTAPVTCVGMVSEASREVSLEPGMNFIGTCFPVDVELDDSNLYESGATGSFNAGDADRVWKWNPCVVAEYDIAWLVDGTGTPYDGTWVTAKQPTYVKFRPGSGYWFQRRLGRTQFDWDYPKPY